MAWLLPSARAPMPSREPVPPPTLKSLAPRPHSAAASSPATATRSHIRRDCGEPQPGTRVRVGRNHPAALQPAAPPQLKPRRINVPPRHRSRPRNDFLFAGRKRVPREDVPAQRPAGERPPVEVRSSSTDWIRRDPAFLGSFPPSARRWGCPRERQQSIIRALRLQVQSKSKTRRSSILRRQAPYLRNRTYCAQTNTAIPFARLDRIFPSIYKEAT